VGTPASAPTGFRRTGRRDYWSRQFAAIASHVEPESFREEDDGNVTVDVHQVVHDAKTSELLSESHVRHRGRFDLTSGREPSCRSSREDPTQTSDHGPARPPNHPGPAARVPGYFRLSSRPKSRAICFCCLIDSASCALTSSSRRTIRSFVAGWAL
jgi:hypothetical protein